MAEEYTVSDSKTGKPEHYQDQDVIETSVNTDGRNQYDWESRYPENARKEMKSEAIYIGIILFVSFVLLICIWCGLIGRIGGHIGLESKIVTSLEGIILYFFSGLMGGTIFGLKYFYRVVARGYWSQDRKYWRIFSPWISACIAFVVGCMVLSGYINAAQSPSFATEKVFCTRSGKEWQVATTTMTIPAGSTVATKNVNITFSHAGTFTTRVAVYNGSALLVTRSGANPDVSYGIGK